MMDEASDNERDLGTKLSRRQFMTLAGTTLAAGSLPGFPQMSQLTAGARARRKAAGEKLNIGLIGTAGRAVNEIKDFLRLNENVVALCDVDPARLESGAKLAAQRFPDARRYTDYRKMLERENGLDAVVVTTPDHMHAPISMLAMAHGLHVFCEKPLTHTVWEARRMAEMARQTGAVTQMGTQASASHQLRHAVEIIRGGVLGNVTEVHIWSNRKAVIPELPASAPLPAGLDWNLWRGVSQAEPEYSKRYHPTRWRWWTAFGEGALGDMGCHMTNVAFRALDLTNPARIEPTISDLQYPGMFPRKNKIVYRFPERNGRKALKLVWYDGGLRPGAEMLAELGIPKQFGKVPDQGKLIIGDKGVMFDDLYVKLNDEERYLGLLKHEACKAVPQSLPRAKEEGTRGHYLEWIEACKGIGSAYASFEMAAAQTEMVLLGCVAIQMGRKIAWDAEKMSVPGEPAAEALLRPVYRPGFTIA